MGKRRCVAQLEPVWLHRHGGEAREMSDRKRKEEERGAGVE